MALSRTKLRARLVAAVFTVAALGSAITMGLSAADNKWWIDYAGGPASARYFPSAAINKSNVASLAVAWTYPYGETGFNPIVARARSTAAAGTARSSRSTRRPARRSGSTRACRRCRRAGMNYWESKDGKDRRLSSP